jgi:hypothetical protein
LLGATTATELLPPPPPLADAEPLDDVFVVWALPAAVPLPELLEPPAEWLALARAADTDVAAACGVLAG